MIFEVPGAQFWVPKWGPKRGPKRDLDAEGVRKPLENLSERSWSLLGKKILLIGSWAVLRKFQDSLRQLRGVRPG